MIIYIIGKYTGLPRDYAVAKFNTSQEKLIGAGIPAANIINPVAIVPEGTNWNDAMYNYCLPALRKCTAVFIQADWTDSEGAKLEIKVACEKRMDLFYEASGDIRDIEYLNHLLV